MKKKRLSVKDSMSKIFEDLINVDKNLQSRMTRAAVRAGERHKELTDQRITFLQGGETKKSLHDSGWYHYMCADDEIEKAIAYVKEAIDFVEQAEKQPKKRLSPKKKEEVKK